MKRKFLSLFTAFAMLISLFGAIPITAGAAEEQFSALTLGEVYWFYISGTELTDYGADVSSAVTVLTAQWEDPHTHPICGASSCTHEDEHTAVEWTPLTQTMIDSVSTEAIICRQAAITSPRT